MSQMSRAKRLGCGAWQVTSSPFSWGRTGPFRRPRPAAPPPLPSPPAALPPSQPQPQPQPQSQSYKNNNASRRVSAPLWRKHAALAPSDDGDGDDGASTGGRGGLGSADERTGREKLFKTANGGGGGSEPRRGFSRGDGDGGSVGGGGVAWRRLRDAGGGADGFYNDDEDDDFNGSSHVRGDGGGYDRGGGGGGDGSEAPLGPSLAEELRELERLYGSADRTRSSYRSRQKWLDRRAAEREAVYGARHRDADVRLLALRRYLAAAGKLRRRGRFAPNDAMPRPSTWHKLPPATQRRILDERAAELLADVGLPLAAGRRLYVAAPGLLCDISYGVAARLRALAARLGCSVEAAAAIAARPLLGELRLDLLEATAAEVSVWLGGSSPPGLVLQKLTEEPSLAAEGSMALISRCEALCGALPLSRPAALKYMVRQPRLMALDPRAIPGRVAAARRLIQLAAGRAAAPAAASPAPPPPPPSLPPPSLLLCTGPQLAECLTLLQRLLALPPPAAAALLASQPALALQPPAALAAAVDFLCANLPPPPPTAAAGFQTGLPPAGRGRRSSATPLEGADPQPDQWRRLRGVSGAAEPSPLGRQPPPVSQQRGPLVRVRQKEGQQQHQQQLPPPHVQLLVRRCPDVLFLEPRRAAAAMEVLAGAMAEATAAEATEAGSLRGGGGGGEEEEEEEGCQVESAWQRARRAAAAMAAGAPRLLLCRLIPPAGGVSGGGGGGGAGGSRQLARSRQTTILALVKAIDEAQRKRRVDAASLALDAPRWPRPLVPLPYEYGAGAVAPAAGGAAAVSVLDGGGGDDGPRGGGGGGGGGGGSAAAAGESALRAAAAAAGVGPIPIDLGLREAELLRVLAPSGLSSHARQGAEGPAASYGRDHAGDGAGGDVYDAFAVRAVRSWLWREVLTAEPGLLLLPPSQLGSTVDALCTWLAVPADALSYYLFPCGVAATGPTTPGSQGPVAAATSPGVTPPPPPRRRRRHHASLLMLRSDSLQRRGYHLWAWLGGAAAAAGADVAAVLRVEPSLLYDRTVMRACALVLFQVLGEAAGGADGADNGGGGGAAAAAAARASTDVGLDVGQGLEGQALPAWVLVRPPTDADSSGGGGGGSGRGSAAAARGLAPGDVAAMPPAAAALLLRFPGDILSDGVLQLLAAAPAAPAAGIAADKATSPARPAVAAAEAAEAAPGARIRSCLSRAVGLLGELLGVGRLAAAALVLTTHGSAARLVEELPPAAVASVERAMAAIRRGDAWRRELRRYLYGSTSSGGGGGWSQGLEAGGESLEAVSASAGELLGLLREWRRVERLEALEAAGMQDAASFATVLQLPEGEWRQLAMSLQL
ncbi:hypothetical protein PLESTM_000193300 [Pleodorina starrii]|nr:hypothetical protein PLESTM_000193300 [Pleodorina starrii]